ncbi:MAG: ribose 5-phosphate isomerase B [Halobacteriovoraceae bacterium]|nr:ribose 5-phosphate isomerase B [Halobacteriovoraceae bacterium]
MKIYIGCDHAAFEAKEQLKIYLSENIQVVDLGTNSTKSCHYPEFAKKVATSVANSENDLGILLCGSGIGVSMVANRFKNVRAALCRTKEDAALSRQHNDANILCLGARTNTVDELIAITDSWLTSKFEGGRHQMRIEMFNGLGESETKS